MNRSKFGWESPRTNQQAEDLRAPRLHQADQRAQERAVAPHQALTCLRMGWTKQGRGGVLRSLLRGVGRGICVRVCRGTVRETSNEYTAVLPLPSTDYRSHFNHTLK